ncbi:class II aldolase/adducin family protein [Kiloniella sp.]|uniref:class II aldolase/adducin family protein n=1 Tax=Kiloniella sp. TaxID=1938587 RepID=UPI003B013E44
MHEISNQEWSIRVDLAACYRLAAQHGWTDLTSTHISARIPEDGTFLLNPLGLHFDEITASSLVKVTEDGEVVSPGGATINKAGYVIHSAIHMAREDVDCIIHTHTRAGMALSAMRDGLLPLNQHALRFYNRLGIHDYEGIALDLDERERLVRDLKTHEAMILRNHGLLSVGKTVADAFNAMFYLEKAAQVQVDLMGAQAELMMPSPEVCEKTAQQYDLYPDIGARDWAGLIRKLDREEPSYKQ